MTETRYYWYIPKHNEIVQDDGAFRTTGLFDAREQAIAFIEQTELPVSPDEVFLVEADTTEREDAALHVGVNWNESTQERDPLELTADEIGTRLDEWDERHTKTLLETLNTVASEAPERLIEHIGPLASRYEGADEYQQHRLASIFKQIAEVGAAQVDPQVAAVHDWFVTNPTTDRADALVTLLPRDSNHVESVIESIISVLTDDTVGYKARLGIATQLSRLIQFPGTAIENVAAALAEQDSLQAELLGIAGLDGAVTSHFDVDELLTYLESTDPVVRRGAVVVIEQKVFRDRQVSLSADTIATLQEALVADWTTNHRDMRNRARDIIAEIANQYPESIAQITDELRNDIKTALEWVSDDPGYGVVKLPEYGTTAATALGRYYATTDTVPTDLVARLVNAGRRRRAQYLTAAIIRECPAVVDALTEYAHDNPGAQHDVYRLLGHVADSIGDGPIRAWDALIDAMNTSDPAKRHACLKGIQTATKADGIHIADIDRFLDRLPDLHRHRNDLSNILANVATDDPAVVAALWDAVETANTRQTPRSDTLRVIAAEALAGVANHRPEYFDDIDRCVTQATGDIDSVDTAFLSVIETVWGDQPAVLKPHYPVLLSHFGIETGQAGQQSLLELTRTMAKEYPDVVKTESLHSLAAHESGHIRTLVYDILGYAGSPAAHALLKDRAKTEDTERGQHAITHACTRLEVRFPKQIVKS